MEGSCRICSFLLLLLFCRIAVCVEIIESGILGQSGNCIDDVNVRFCKTVGLAPAQNGGFIFYADNALYELWPGKGVERLFGVPRPIRSVAGDGRRIYLLDKNGTVYEYGYDKGRVLNPVFTLRRRVRNFTVMPESIKNGWGKSMKFAALSGTEVLGYDRTGHPLSRTIQLPAPPKGNYYNALSFLPESGDMIVATSYPACLVRRISSDGREVMSGGWPKFGNYFNLFSDNRAVWGTNLRAFRLEEIYRKGRRLMVIGVDDACITGVATVAGDGYYLSTTQGLMRYPLRASEDPERIGGLPEMDSIAVNCDGMIAALSPQKRNRIWGMMIDDWCNTPLLSSDNQHGRSIWQPVASRSRKAISVASSGDDFYVLTESGEIWSFSPDDRSEVPKKYPTRYWEKLSGSENWNNPSAIAASDQCVWVIDSGKLYSWCKGKKNMINLPKQENTTQVAALLDDILVAQDNRLTLLHNTCDGTTREIWSGDLGESPCSLALHEKFIVAGVLGRISLFDRQGRSVAEYPLDGFRGGLAVRESWIVASDRLNYRLVRLKIKD